MQQGCDGLESCQTLTLKSSTNQEKLTSMRTACPEFQEILRNTWTPVHKRSLTRINTAGSHIRSMDSGNAVWITSITDQPDVLDTDKRHVLNQENLSQIKMVDIAKAQRDDRTISRVLWYVNSNTKPTFEDRQQETREVKRNLRELNKLHVEKKTGILYRANRLYCPFSVDGWCIVNSMKKWDTSEQNACSL